MKVSLQKLIAFLLLLALSLQAADTFNIVIVHYWNKKEIAATLCINKNKPELKCGGNCQLMKSLKKSENTNKSSKSTLQKSIFLLLDLPINDVLPKAALSFAKTTFRSYKGTFHSTFFQEIIIPPPRISDLIQRMVA